ncbi:hypothetical protein PF005_g13736 [Phytophthora fragariae]|uniref:Uncharacterized protein n=1 Tax=Phytophthora fragariae TaxID=53985 RepID=A0A6A3XWM5_9STRA|nr:hypothetical protein PF005_g13736 [Phytophthora fragariae]
MSDDDYRFGVKARLSQVDTNSVLKRKRQRSRKTCQDLLRGRDAGPYPQRARVRQVNRGAPPQPDGARVYGRSSAARHRPTTKKVVIPDLAVTFEEHAAIARHSSLQLSHDHNTLKYQPIVAELRLKGWQVRTAAIVYGSLGSVQPSNINTYTEKLMLHKREARQLDLQLSGHCIRTSHCIWGWHCRRYREGRAPRVSGWGTSQARTRR